MADDGKIRVAGDPRAEDAIGPQVHAGSHETPGPSGKGGSKSPSPEAIERLARIRDRLQQSVGQIVLSLMRLPRYRHQTLADIEHLVLDPLLADRIAIAHNAPKEGADPAMSDVANLAGIAIWASVSDEVDARIREQAASGIFPVRLSARDWSSGDRLWLLDIVAGDRANTTRLLANFRQIAGERPVRIHPIVARSVDPDVLERLRAPEDEDAGDGDRATSA